MATVLVVDDESDLRLIFRTFLERSGHTVVDADSGGAALELLGDRTRVFDCVLLDLRMPGIDGWQVLETLGRERIGEVPVIVVSAHVDAAGVDRALELGCRGYLSKPFTRTQLDAALETVTTSDGVVGG